MAAGFHSGLISLSELKLEYMKAHRNAYGERMTEAQEQQLEEEAFKDLRWIETVLAYAIDRRAFSG